MKISKLINELEKIKKKYGDLNMSITDGFECTCYQDQKIIVSRIYSGENGTEQYCDICVGN
jgi:hypothetical protein